MGTSTKRPVAFNLPFDFAYAGIDWEDLDMDAIEALYAATAERLGYKAVFGGEALHLAIMSEWDDITPLIGSEAWNNGDDPLRLAWQLIHDCVGYTDITTCKKKGNK